MNCLRAGYEQVVYVLPGISIFLIVTAGADMPTMA